MRVDSGRVRMVAGVLRRDGQVLVCHRRADRTSWPEVWDLPGGHVDDDESRAAALVRELDEELGIHIEAPVGSPWTTLQTDGMELSIYLLDHWRGEPHNAAPDEHDIIRWVTAEALPHLDLAHPSYNKLLRQGSTAV